MPDWFQRQTISCYLEEDKYNIENEEINDKYIEHNNINEYCRWLINKKKKGYTVIFHNGAGFDFHFIQ